jgi:cytochrome P450
VASAKRLGDYTSYLQSHIDARREVPRDDLISDLIHGKGEHQGVPDAYEP